MTTFEITRRPVAGQLRGSTLPRLFTPPLVTGPPGSCGCGCALTPATSLGFNAVGWAGEIIGISLQPWQRWLLIHAMELRKDPDGTYRQRQFRFRTVLILVARQNGKTTLIEIKNLWKMFVLEVGLILGAAQSLDTAEESWNKAVELVEEIPELDAEKLHVDKTNGKKALRLVNGSKWRVIAATRKAGRGMSADDVNLDELREHLDWLSWGAVTKTTMAKPNAQTYAFSNAGDDRSVVLNQLQGTGRGLCLAAEQGMPVTDDTFGHFEWSVEGKVRCDCGRADPNPDDPEDIPEPHRDDCMLNDRQLWAQANPALGYGTLTEAAIRSALNTDPNATFLTEVLCQRVSTMAPEWQVVTLKEWEAVALATPERPTDIALSLEISKDLKKAAIVAVGPRPGRPDELVGVVIEWRDNGAWVVPRMVELKNRYRPVAVAVQDKGPSGAVEVDIRAAGIKLPIDKDRPKRGDLVNPWASDVADAYGMTLDKIRRRELFHIDEAPLNVGMAKAENRKLSGATDWSTDVDPPVRALSLALWAYVTRVDAVTTTYDPLANIG